MDTIGRICVGIPISPHLIVPVEVDYLRDGEHIFVLDWWINPRNCGELTLAQIEDVLARATKAVEEGAIHARP